MKVTALRLHSPGVEQSLAADRELREPVVPPREPAAAELGSGAPPSIEVVAVYRTHADFLWRSLQHLGVRDADLEDMMQEVLMVVHKRRDSYDFDCKLTTWLFGICLRVASRQRRRAHVRYERDEAQLPELRDSATPEDRMAEQQIFAQLQGILNRLTIEQHATFVMFEIEGQSCQEIAELFDVPLGTVYSRLHHARKTVHASLLRKGFGDPMGGRK